MTTDTLRARAEELLTENADADRPDPRSWMDAADRLIRDLIAALPADQPAPLTVGDALRWTHAAEYVEPSRSGDTGPACWCQAAGESWRFWRPDAVGGPRWSSWTRGVPAEDLTAACRLVPLAEADADPAGRGGL